MGGVKREMQPEVDRARERERQRELDRAGVAAADRSDGAGDTWTSSSPPGDWCFLVVDTGLVIRDALCRGVSLDRLLRTACPGCAGVVLFTYQDVAMAEAEHQADLEFACCKCCWLRGWQPEPGDDFSNHAAYLAKQLGRGED
jgi:hypothetical protein